MHKDTTLRKKIEKNLMLKRRNKTIEIKAETNYTKQVTGKINNIKSWSIKRLMKFSFHSHMKCEVSRNPIFFKHFGKPFAAFCKFKHTL